MPDVSGWPTSSEVQAKLTDVLGAPLPSSVTDDLASLLAAVKAEFQSPVGQGGTGRLFTPTVATRLFDGSGTWRLKVEPFVPLLEGGTDPVVLVDGVGPLAGLKWRRAAFPGPYEWIERPLVAGALMVFALGVENVSMTATWGFAATVPTDVWEAVRSEVASRAVVQGKVPLAGIGNMVTLGPYSVNTAAGVSVWKESSPIAVWHRTYEECIARYTDPQAKWERFAAGLPGTGRRLVGRA